MTFDQYFSAPLIVLAQEGAGSAAPAPGEAVQGANGSPNPAGNGATPGQGAGGQQQGAPPMGSSFLWFMIIAFGAMIAWSIYAQRRDRKKRESMLGTMRKHDRVQTVGGVIGSVVEVKENTIVLKVDESTNTRITFARSAVQQILSADSDKPGAVGSPSELEGSTR